MKKQKRITITLPENEAERKQMLIKLEDEVGVIISADEKTAVVEPYSKSNPKKYPEGASETVEGEDIIDKSVKLDAANEEDAIVTLKRMAYKDATIIARKIGKYMFEYWVVYKGEVYSWYIVLKPEKPKEGEPMRSLTRDEILRGTSVILNAGATTIDSLIDNDPKERKRWKNKLKKMQNNKNMLN